MTTVLTDAQPRCPWCGQPFHSTLCPMVKAMEYFENGTVRRIEFWTRAELDAMLVAAQPGHDDGR